MPTLRWAARIAAAVIIAVSGYYMTTNYIYNKDAQPQTITVPAGQRAQITLADGTRVWLNAQSTLTYASDFGRNDRNVELDGEAYFEVAKNKKLPFYVHTEMHKVRVVGTSFNVCAYKGSKEFETTLVEGIVDIYPSCNNQVITRLQKDEFLPIMTDAARKPSSPRTNISAGKRDYTVLMMYPSAASWTNSKILQRKDNRHQPQTTDPRRPDRQIQGTGWHRAHLESHLQRASVQVPHQ